MLSNHDAALLVINTAVAAGLEIQGSGGSKASGFEDMWRMVQGTLTRCCRPLSECLPGPSKKRSPSAQTATKTDVGARVSENRSRVWPQKVLAYKVSSGAKLFPQRRLQHNG